MVLDIELKISMKVLGEMVYLEYYVEIGNDYRGIVLVCIICVEEVWLIKVNVDCFEDNNSSKYVFVIINFGGNG